MTSFLQTMLEASGSTRTYLYMSSQNPRVAPTPTVPPSHLSGYVALSEIPQCSQETPADPMRSSEGSALTVLSFPLCLPPATC